MRVSTTREERDRFLREVVASLVDDNSRWPGLWTRIESLLDERDSLELTLHALTRLLHTALEDAMVLREEAASNDGLAAGLVETLLLAHKELRA
jgi:hypothetical protein